MKKSDSLLCILVKEHSPQQGLCRPVQCGGSGDIVSQVEGIHDLLSSYGLKPLKPRTQIQESKFLTM